ncbi:MAG: FABP family protein [Actinomycetota bacterium]
MAGYAQHERLAEISFLLGTWRGGGDGEWPGAVPFRYGEEMTFEHAGDAYLLYSQRSWSFDDGSPISFERGFVRPAGPGLVELVVAHPLGVAEIAEGTVRDRVIEVETTSIGLTATGPAVTGIRRRLEATEDALAYELHMAMREVPLTSHVRARLARV